MRISSRLITLAAILSVLYAISRWGIIFICWDSCGRHASLIISAVIVTIGFASWYYLFDKKHPDRKLALVITCVLLLIAVFAVKIDQKIKKTVRNYKKASEELSIRNLPDRIQIKSFKETPIMMPSGKPVGIKINFKVKHPKEIKGSFGGATINLMLGRAFRGKQNSSYPIYLDNRIIDNAERVGDIPANPDGVTEVEMYFYPVRTISNINKSATEICRFEDEVETLSPHDNDENEYINGVLDRIEQLPVLSFKIHTGLMFEQESGGAKYVRLDSVFNEKLKKSKLLQDKNFWYDIHMNSSSGALINEGYKECPSSLNEKHPDLITQMTCYCK